MYGIRRKTKDPFVNGRAKAAFSPDTSQFCSHFLSTPRIVAIQRWAHILACLSGVGHTTERRKECHTTAWTAHREGITDGFFVVFCFLAEKCVERHYCFHPVISGWIIVI